MTSEKDTSQESSPSTTVLSQKEWGEIAKLQQIDKQVPVHEGSSWVGLELRPKNVRFATQNKGEKIFMLLRRHWVTNTGWVLSLVFYAAIPWIIGFIASLFSIDIVGDFGSKMITLILFFYYSGLFTLFLKNFTFWFYNLYLVTNERIVDYDYKPFVSRGASEIALENIEDVSEKSIGFIPSMFDYGDVDIYSAAEKSAIIFAQVPKPTLVRDKITDLAEIAKRFHSNES